MWTDEYNTLELKPKEVIDKLDVIDQRKRSKKYISKFYSLSNLVDDDDDDFSEVNKIQRRDWFKNRIKRSIFDILIKYIYDSTKRRCQKYSQICWP